MHERSTSISTSDQHALQAAALLSCYETRAALSSFKERGVNRTPQASVERILADVATAGSLLRSPALTSPGISQEDGVSPQRGGLPTSRPDVAKLNQHQASPLRSTSSGRFPSAAANSAPQQQRSSTSSSLVSPGPNSVPQKGGRQPLRMQQGQRPLVTVAPLVPRLHLTSSDLQQQQHLSEPAAQAEPRTSSFRDRRRRGSVSSIASLSTCKPGLTPSSARSGGGGGSGSRRTGESRTVLVPYPIEHLLQSHNQLIMREAHVRDEGARLSRRGSRASLASGSIVRQQPDFTTTSPPSSAHHVASQQQQQRFRSPASLQLRAREVNRAQAALARSFTGLDSSAVSRSSRGTTHTSSGDSPSEASSTVTGVSRASAEMSDVSGGNDSTSGRRMWRRGSSASGSRQQPSQPNGIVKRSSSHSAAARAMTQGPRSASRGRENLSSSIQGVGQILLEALAQDELQKRVKQEAEALLLPSLSSPSRRQAVEPTAAASLTAFTEPSSSYSSKAVRTHVRGIGATVGAGEGGGVMSAHIAATSGGQSSAIDDDTALAAGAVSSHEDMVLTSSVSTTAQAAGSNGNGNGDVTSPSALLSPGTGGDPVPAMIQLLHDISTAEAQRTRAPVNVRAGGTSVSSSPASYSAGQGATGRAITLLEAMLRSADAGSTGTVEPATFAVCIRRAFPSIAWPRIQQLADGMHLQQLHNNNVDVADFVAALRQLAANMLFV